MRCRMERDSVRIAQAVLQRVSEAGPLPFELRVLEALLDETARQVREGVPSLGQGKRSSEGIMHPHARPCNQKLLPDWNEQYHALV